VNGILNVNKPQGKTSYSMVALVKRLSGERRVGHAGTLDPLASGVLPICLGQGARAVEFLAEVTKVYRAQIELGVVTDTYDAEGTVTERKDPSEVSREQVTSALNLFLGRIQQVPPMYSAVKHQGKPLYKLARSGVQVERASRPVEVHRLELLDWQPPVVTVEVECGKGTYIRSLAHDLGQVLGCGATLKSLIRTRYGPFTVEESVSFPELEEAFRHGHWQPLLYPVDTALLHYQAVAVDDATGLAIKNGKHIVLEKAKSQDVPHTETGSEAAVEDVNRCRAYTQDGYLLAVLRYEPEKGCWHPEKVFIG
jgi:tRNA pseudouridine55 synthase